MFKTANAILQQELREAHRREQRYLDLIRELNDRLASAHDKPWILPPRPLEPEPAEQPDEFEEFVPV
jgi:hypothetical protein